MAEEKHFEMQIREFLEWNGIVEAGTPEQNLPNKINGWYFKVWGGGFQKAGIPDLIICVKGCFVAVEVKASKGKPSELQKKNIDLIKKSNGYALFLYPSGFEDFRENIRFLLKGGD